MGILVLLSWQSSLWMVSALGPEYVPMAPSTALMMLLLGSSIFAQRHWPSATVSRLLALVAALGVFVYGLMALVQFPFAFELPLERWLAPVNASLGDIPLGRMSPLTAASFTTSALAVLLMMPSRGRFMPFRQVSATLALGIFLMSLLVMLSYGLGAPILYDGRTIPMALSTAILFVLLGCASMAAAGPGTWLFAIFKPGRISASSSSFFRSSLGPIAVILIFAVAIGATGFFYLEHQLTGGRKKAQEELAAIAKLKALQITAWHNERLADARIILDNAMAQEHVRQFLSGSTPDQARADLMSWFESLRNNSEYTLVALYDHQGSARMWVPAALPALDPEDREALQAASRAEEVVETDLHLHQGENGARGPEVHYNFLVPIRAKAGSAELADGVLLLQVNVDKFLYPLMDSWPTPSRTGETVLVRREGDEVVFLNELRHSPKAPLTLRLPLDAPGKLPAAEAVKGRKGVIEGMDYRGVPVLAAIREVPGTPWFMVAKEDQEEIYAPLRERAITTGIIVLISILLAGMGVGLFWRQRDNQWLHEQLASEQERQALADRIVSLHNQANDIILLLDPDWRILEANQRALQAYGYSSEELLGLSVRELRAREGRADFDRHLPQSGETGEPFYETVHQRKDGSIFPVEVSISGVEIGGQGYRTVRPSSATSASARGQRRPGARMRPAWSGCSGYRSTAHPMSRSCWTTPWRRP